MTKDLTYNRNYGILTDFSQGLNEFLGDESGRTVSLRTSHGLKNVFDLDISDVFAEDIVHAGMIFAGYNLLAKKGNTGLGFIALIALIALYQAGE